MTKENERTAEEYSEEKTVFDFENDNVEGEGVASILSEHRRMVSAKKSGG